MGKVYTRFQTETTQKPYRGERTYMAYEGVGWAAKACVRSVLRAASLCDGAI